MEEENMRKTRMKGRKREKESEKRRAEETHQYG
jgi:hypothetical protein